MTDWRLVDALERIEEHLDEGIKELQLAAEIMYDEEAYPDEDAYEDLGDAIGTLQNLAETISERIAIMEADDDKEMMLRSYSW